MNKKACLPIYIYFSEEANWSIGEMTPTAGSTSRFICNFYMISLEFGRIFNLREDFIFSIRQSTLIVIVSLCEHHMCESLWGGGRTKRIPGGAWVRSTSALYSKCHQSPPLSVASRPNSNLGAACH